MERVYNNEEGLHVYHMTEQPTVGELVSDKDHLIWRCTCGWHCYTKADEKPSKGWPLTLMCAECGSVDGMETILSRYEYASHIERNHRIARTDAEILTEQLHQVRHERDKWRKQEAERTFSLLRIQQQVEDLYFLVKSQCRTRYVSSPASEVRLWARLGAMVVMSQQQWDEDPEEAFRQALEQRRYILDGESYIHTDYGDEVEVNM